jgi:hypothetical protein
MQILKYLNIVYISELTATTIRTLTKYIYIYLVGGTQNNKHLNAYFIPFIYAKFNPNISADVDPFVSYTFGMFILNLTVLVCFVNIIGYILSLYLINKYDIDKKFPKFKRYINFYKTTNKFFLILEVIIAFIILIFLVLVNF